MSYSEIQIKGDIEIKTKDNIKLTYINAWCNGFYGSVSVIKPQGLSKGDYLKELDKICCKNKKRKHKIK